MLKIFEIIMGDWGSSSIDIFGHRILKLSFWNSTKILSPIFVDVRYFRLRIVIEVQNDISFRILPQRCFIFT